MDTTRVKNFLAGLDLPKISEEHRLLCEEDITKEDLYESFKSMQGGKSPGNDSL